MNQKNPISCALNNDCTFFTLGKAIYLCGIVQCARKWRHMIAITTSPAMISILVVVYVGIWCFYVLSGGWRQISERHYVTSYLTQRRPKWSKIVGSDTSLEFPNTHCLIIFFALCLKIKIKSGICKKQKTSNYSGPYRDLDFLEWSWSEQKQSD